MATLPSIRAFGNIRNYHDDAVSPSVDIYLLPLLIAFYMLIGKQSGQYVCSRCHIRPVAPLIPRNGRLFSQSRRLPQQAQHAIRDEDETDRAEEEAEMRQEVGRMTDRLAQMTEQSIERGGKGARKAVEEAGFSEELKKQLEERFKQSKFRSENVVAFAEVNMPVCCVNQEQYPRANATSRQLQAREPVKWQQHKLGVVKKASATPL